MCRRVAWWPAALAIAWPELAWAHGGAHVDEELAWDLATAGTLAVLAAAYLVGLARSRTISIARAASYLAGLAVVALAQLSSLDTASEIWFSAHMGQHELQILFAAPLIVVGRPELVLRAALPATSRSLVRSFVHRRSVHALLRVLANRWLALVLHGVVVWLWHIPALFEAALHSETIHVLQHLSFFATAALFWWAMSRGRYGQAAYGLAVVFVFLTALHKGLLAMLLTVAGRTLYPTHVARTEAAGGDALRDQELAGLIMWVPAGVVMAALALGLFVAWLGALERREESRHARD